MYRGPVYQPPPQRPYSPGLVPPQPVYGFPGQSYNGLAPPTQPTYTGQLPNYASVPGMNPAPPVSGQFPGSPMPVWEDEEQWDDCARSPYAYERPPRRSRSRSPVSRFDVKDTTGDPVIDAILESCPAEDIKGITEVQEKERYMVKYRLWHPKRNVFLPYDPETVPPPPPEKEDAHNFFYVEVRYTPGFFQDPARVLTHWSPTLLSFLRATVGGDSFDAKYEAPVLSLLFHIHDFEEKLNEARKIQAGSLDGMGIEEKLKTTSKLGFKAPLNEKHTDDEIDTFIEELDIQLGYLMKFLRKEFQPLKEHLELLLSHNQIDYSVLQFFYKKEQEYVISSSFAHNLPMAFILKRIETNKKGPKDTLILKGEAHRWDGVKFKKVRHIEEIAHFKGTVPLSDLRIKPLSEETKQMLKERGKKYVELAGIHYKSYQGQRIMVDNYNNFLNSNDIALGSASMDITKVSEKSLHLLPAYMAGFNLETKTWNLAMEVDKIRPVQFDEGAWDHLVLDPDTKDLIRGLVDATRQANNKESVLKDVISGKGGGLIACLHGAPGTGKTLTAESIAEHLKRPLYVVSASELSLDPATMENKLRGLLQLATAWDAVLLIDEADVILERRSMHEMARNTLVSVSLRVLEYHKGVVFLTTNRLSAFDEAFLSRFSIAIKYPDLDKTARLTVWRKFFELAGCLVGKEQDRVHDDDGKPTTFISEEDLDELSEKPFNGRTVKSLISTAQSVALSLNEPLAIKHIKTVVRVQEKFERDFAAIKLE